VSEAHNEARRILIEKRDILEVVTRRLLDKEVMEGDELRKILAGTYISDENTSATAAPATQSTT
jgi:ATP-dependent Zn protease